MGNKYGISTIVAPFRLHPCGM